MAKKKVKKATKKVATKKATTKKKATAKKATKKVATKKAAPKKKATAKKATKKVATKKAAPKKKATVKKAASKKITALKTITNTTVPSAAELLKEKAAIEERLGRIGNDLRSPLEQDADEQAIQLENREVLERLQQIEQQNLARINSDLAKVKQ